MANPTKYSQLLMMSIQKPLLLPQTKHLSVSPKDQKYLSSIERMITVGGMEGFRKGLEMGGLSVNTARHISDARREGSIAN